MTPEQEKRINELNKQISTCNKGRDALRIEIRESEQELKDSFPFSSKRKDIKAGIAWRTKAVDLYDEKLSGLSTELYKIEWSLGIVQKRYVELEENMAKKAEIGIQKPTMLQPIRPLVPNIPSAPRHETFRGDESPAVSQMRGMATPQTEGFIKHLFAGAKRSRHLETLAQNLQAATDQSKILEFARNTESAEYTHKVKMAVDEAMAQNQLEVARLATEQGVPAAEYGAYVARSLDAQLQVWVNFETAKIQASLTHQEHLYALELEKERRLTDIEIKEREQCSARSFEPVDS